MMNSTTEPRTLELVRMNLKCGDYDGVDIMRAWIAIDDLLKQRKQVIELISAAKEIITISDRKHDAWDKAKLLISEIEAANE
jgi:hypothetical protein